MEKQATKFLTILIIPAHYSNIENQLKKHQQPFLPNSINIFFWFRDLCTAKTAACASREE